MSTWALFSNKISFSPSLVPSSYFEVSLRVFVRRTTRTGNWWTDGFPATGTTWSCQLFPASSSRSRCPTSSRVWTLRHNTRLKSRLRTGSAGTRRARRSSFTPEGLVSIAHYLCSPDTLSQATLWIITTYRTETYSKSGYIFFNP